MEGVPLRVGLYGAIGASTSLRLPLQSLTRFATRKNATFIHRLYNITTKVVSARYVLTTFCCLKSYIPKTQHCSSQQIFTVYRLLFNNRDISSLWHCCFLFSLLYYHRNLLSVKHTSCWDIEYLGSSLGV